MPRVYELIHEIGNNTVGQFGIEPYNPIGIGEYRTVHYDANSVQDIMFIENDISSRLIASPINDVFATSYTFGVFPNTISSFPEIQTINQNHTRTDMVHGIGNYRNTCQPWINHFPQMLNAVCNMFQGNGIPDLNQEVQFHLKKMLSLFCVELGRSPSSLVTTAMFYEMCLLNPYLLNHVDYFYPMAKLGAVPNFRQIYNDNSFNLPFNTAYLYDVTNGGNVLDARRMLHLEETLTIDWYNTVSFFNPLPDPDTNLIINFTGTQINNNQALDLRAELFELGMRVYGLPLAGELEEEKDIGWINHYFGKYTIDGLSDILKLRVADANIKNIEIVNGIYIDQENNNITKLLTDTDIVNTSEKIILVPLNLFNKHAVGLIFKRTEDNSLRVKYIDSMNKPIPTELLQIIKAILPDAKYEQITVEQQRYANCAPEIIENFIFYLTGNRITQEKAIELHSQLIENSLLGKNTFGTWLLFKDKYKEDSDLLLSSSKYLSYNLDEQIDYNFRNDQDLVLIGDNHLLDN